jgi:MarR family transcriptional regulator, transcriptional regulator for hemolysin
MTAPDEDVARATDIRCFEHLVHVVDRRYRIRFNQRLRALGLTQAQWTALGALSRHEGINQMRLAALIKVEPITLARLLDRMESRGWVERRPDIADRRTHRLFPGARARPVFAAAARIAEEVEAEALSGLDRSDRAWLSAMLGTMSANLSTWTEALVRLDGDKRQRLTTMLADIDANLSAAETPARGAMRGESQAG